MKQVLWLLFAITIGVYIAGSLIDPDLWWHATVGRWIVAHSAVPVVDHWNMFAAGKPWVAYSWSNELIIGLADRAFGIKGLLVLQAIIAVLLSISLAVGFSLLSRDWFFGLLLGAFTTLSCISHFSLRPQTLTWIYYVAALVLADRIFVGWFSVEVRARDADCVFLCGRMRTLRRHLVFLLSLHGHSIKMISSR